MVQHLKVLMSQPLLYVPLAAGEVVVNHKHFMTIEHQLVNQVGPNKASSSSDQDPLSVLVCSELDIRIRAGGGQSCLQLSKLGLQDPGMQLNIFTFICQSYFILS